MSDWPPPPPDPPPPPYPPSAPAPAWTPYPYAPPTPPVLPWWRTTPAIVIGALLCLFVGGLGGVIVAVAGEEVIGGSDEGYTPAEAYTYGAGGDLDTIDLAPGQCARPDIDDLDTLDASVVADCATEHATEVYATAELPAVGGDSVLDVGRDDLSDYADHACFLAFEPYVGKVYDDSSYDYIPVIPSVRAWADGDRTIHCVLYPYDADTTRGSANGSGR